MGMEPRGGSRCRHGSGQAVSRGSLIFACGFEKTHSRKFSKRPKVRCDLALSGTASGWALLWKLSWGFFYFDVLPKKNVSMHFAKRAKKESDLALSGTASWWVKNTRQIQRTLRRDNVLMCCVNVVLKNVFDDFFKLT